MNIKLMIYGAIIGVANIIPGVSGGTMAVILNIYDKLIASISNLRTDFKKSMAFLIPIGIGGGIGILLFSKLIDFCLSRFEIATGLVFIGLIIGSIPMILKKTMEDEMSKSSRVVFALAVLLMVYMGIASPDDSTVNVIESLTLSSGLRLFLCSVIAAGAMIIPGISGSFILLLLGIYTSILTAVSNLNIIVLIPVALGCMVGVLLFAKVIDKLFENFKQETYCGILGLMVGSIFIIFPGFFFGLEFIIGVLLAAVAGVMAYQFSK